MFEAKQSIAEYTRHLPDSSNFNLGQAFYAMQQFYSSECDGCEDDGLVYLAGIFDEDSPNFQVALCRFYDLFSKFTVTIKYSNGIRSYFATNSNIAATERNESTQFFADVIATRSFWLFKNVKPLTCSIEYEDADDRDDEFYTGFAKFAAEM